MENTAVRRQLILEYLPDCQHTTAGELSCAFQVCSRTIRRDITVLSCTYPITMLQGAGGGVFIAKSFRLGTRYLTDEQCRLLEKLSATLEGTELKTMQSILKKFKRPRV